MDYYFKLGFGDEQVIGGEKGYTEVGDRKFMQGLRE